MLPRIFFRGESHLQTESHACHVPTPANSDAYHGIGVVARRLGVFLVFCWTGILFYPLLPSALVCSVYEVRLLWWEKVCASYISETAIARPPPYLLLSHHSTFWLYKDVDKDLGDDEYPPVSILKVSATRKVACSATPQLSLGARYFKHRCACMFERVIAVPL